MKKLFIIAVLIICIVGITSTVCYAQEFPQVPSVDNSDAYVTFPYAVVKGTSTPATIKNSLPLYSDVTNNEIVCYVPPTYYICPIGPVPENKEWKGVLYNGVILYVKIADLDKYTEMKTDLTIDKFNDGVSPFYTAEIEPLGKVNTIIHLFPDQTSAIAQDKDNNLNCFLKKDMTSCKFIGLALFNDTIYYYMSATAGGTDYFGYILPTECNMADINLLSIQNHPYYVPPAEPEVTPDSPSIDPADPEDKPIVAKNNLVQNILIGIICVLCVGAVFLVYRPKSKLND